MVLSISPDPVGMGSFTAGCVLATAAHLRSRRKGRRLKRMQEDNNEKDQDQKDQDCQSDAHAFGVIFPGQTNPLQINVVHGVKHANA